MSVQSRTMILRKGVAASIRSTVALMLLFMVVAGVSVLSGSIALLADAVHTVTDLVGSVVVWIGLRLSIKKSTDQFPYGFYKAESISALIVSIIIVFAGVEILGNSVGKFNNPSAISFRPLVIGVAIGSGLVSYYLARYKGRVGREINSQALRVESKHSLIDVTNAGLVSCGVLFTYLNIPWAEALAGGIIGIFILFSGIRFGKDSLFSLMDISVEPEMKKEVEEVIINVPGVQDVHALRIRRSGPFLFADAHLEVDKMLTVERAHKIAEKVEDAVKRRFEKIDTISIHIGMAHHSQSL